MQTFFHDRLRDLRFAARSLRNRPGFTAVAVLTLALGIGANTAIFSVVQPVLLRPLPYPRPDELVWITNGIPQFRAEMVSGADFLDWRDGAKSVSGLAAYSTGRVTAAGISAGSLEPERLQAVRASASLWSLLGAAPTQGRLLRSDDQRLPGVPVVVLTSSLWRRLFGETRLKGQRMTLDGNSYEVVGVLPESFRFPSEIEPDLYLPLVLDEARERARRQMEVVQVIGRLGEGVDPEQARAELQTIRDRAVEEAFGKGSEETPEASGQEPEGGVAHTRAIRLKEGQSLEDALKEAGLSEEEIARVQKRAGQHLAEPQPGDQVGPETRAGSAAGRRPRPLGGGRMEIRVERRGSGGKGAGGSERPGLPEAFTRVVPLQEHLVGEVRPVLLILFAAVGVVLLVACVNVAHLLLARASSRQREMAVRAALGAGRARVTAQLLTESVLLAGLGGLAGVAVAWAGLRMLLVSLPADLWGGLLQRAGVGLDLPVLGFTLLLSLATGVLFGFAPALLVGRGQVGEALKEAGSQTSAGRRRGRLNRALVVAEVAVSVVLLVGAGLLVRSFVALSSVDPGFSAERVLTFALNVDPQHTGLLEEAAGRESWAAFYRQLLPRLEALPGVQSAALGDVVPLVGFSRIALGVEVAGVEPPPPDQMREMAMTAVTPDYFRTLGIPVLDGRAFQASDRFGSAPVGVVNRTMVEQFFGGSEPLGKRITIRRDRPPVTVVGVVGDVRHEGLDQPVKAQLYLPLDQQPLPFAFVALRTTVDPGSLIRAVERVVHELDPTLPLSNVATLQDRLASSVAQPRFQATLVGLFAVLALVLAAVGLYGVMVYRVTERRRELGIRMTLGADRPRLVRGVLAQALGMAGFGVVLGLLTAAGLTRVLEARLFGVEPLDPVTFGAIPLLLLAVVVLASLVPARRAVTVDPARMLREE
jgi:predicted permease